MSFLAGNEDFFGSLILSACGTCAELEERLEPEECHCRKGRFDKRKPRWFAPVGITKPNKTVAQAQKDCPFYNLKEGL